MVRVRKNIIWIFGGYSIGGVNNDIYELNLNEMRWILLDSFGIKPSER